MNKNLIAFTLSCFIVYRASADSIETAGDAIAFLIPTVAYTSTFYMDDSEGRVEFYKSFATNGVITLGLKNIVKKKRPNGLNHSFPSGHTSISFQGATYIYKRYGFKYALSAYIGALFVGYSRVESKNHYIEDVLAGAAIGFLSSVYFTTSYKGVTLQPLVKNKNYGVYFSKKW